MARLPETVSASGATVDRVSAIHLWFCVGSETDPGDRLTIMAHTKQLVVLFECDDGVFKAFVETTQLTFVNGRAKKRLAAREERYMLLWTVKGRSGSGFTVQIEAPAEATFKKSFTVGEDGNAAGFRRFPITED